jgi:sugar phosphate isomerase/epimerase
VAALRDAGYSGYYSVEHHSAKNEYSEAAGQVGARTVDDLLTQSASER